MNIKKEDPAQLSVTLILIVAVVAVACIVFDYADLPQLSLLRSHSLLACVPAPDVCYEAVDNKGCSSYVHMDSYATHGVTGGSTSVAECATAVKNYDGTDGCRADFFFLEDPGYCNCPKDTCALPYENTNAGGSGQLFKFVDCDDGELVLLTSIFGLQTLHYLLSAPLRNGFG